MEQHFFYQLMDKYLEGSASDQERRIVETYYDQLSGENHPALDEAQKASLKRQILSGIQSGIRSGIHPQGKLVSMRRRFIKKAAVAAAALLLLAGAAWFALHLKGSGEIASLPQEQRFRNEITPAHNAVTLTLSDGSTIRLDSAVNGAVATQGTTQLLKKDSTLAYNPNPQSATNPSQHFPHPPVSGSVPLFNTLATGKGRTFHLRLSDGTEVWLDALSSIRFPTSFKTAKERTVEVTGQAYLEVAKDKARPFIVRTSRQMTTVLGTSFNIDAYRPEIKTTLLEGAVKINAGKAQCQLAPGQQSELNQKYEGILTRKDVDLEEVVAWKNGRFRFSGATIGEIMDQAARWYDMDVVYKDQVPETFVANLPRDLPLTRLLSLLEMTKEVAFTIEGRRITVWSVHPPPK